MDITALKNLATWARKELISQVGARLTAVIAPGSSERIEHPRSIETLEHDIAAADDTNTGKAAIIDKVAYVWFNRIVALRFMDANGYTGIGVVSPPGGRPIGQPEILADAKRAGVNPTVVSNQRMLDVITGLLEGTRPSPDPQGEAYRLLLSAYCRYWSRTMPFMFTQDENYTELLVPSNLLSADSILARVTSTLTDEVCQDVEVIGWLYQFYISERKDEVFKSFKKGKKAGAAEIPAATQLFTPHWIVRYLVENSVGRLWMLNHPSSQLIKQMDYYIAPVDDETEFLRIDKPEDLTVIDPACGSGHMLTYAFDLLYLIYEEEGYAPSEIPGLILKHNLHGAEIDPRAGALAAFALMMKARAKQRTFLRRPTAPQIRVLEPTTFTPDELDALVTTEGDLHEVRAFWNLFAHADIFGSLLRPDLAVTAQLEDHLATLDDEGGILRAELIGKARQVLDQAKLLSTRYAVAVANPPYMGSKQMNAQLSQFMKDEYPTGKADLMAAFMVRSQELTQDSGTWAMINLPSWMALKSFEALRGDLLSQQHIVSMVHLGRGIFGSDFGTVAFIIDNTAAKRTRGIYRRLFEQHVDVRSVTAIEALFKDAHYNRFEVYQPEFEAIPGTPIVYWLSEKMRAVFAAGMELGEVASLAVGLQTGDNNRFLRLWWEVSQTRTAFGCMSREEATASGARWFPYNKGGDFRRWYGNQEFVVNWENDGASIRAFGTGERSRPRSRAQNMGTYFSPSVSWSDISSGAPSFRSFPAGFIHGNKGNSIFGVKPLLNRLLGIMNSPCATALLEAVVPTMTASVGDVAKTPLPSADWDLPEPVIERLVQTSRADWDDSETSWGFTGSPLLKAGPVQAS